MIKIFMILLYFSIWKIDSCTILSHAVQEKAVILKTATVQHTLPSQVNGCLIYAYENLNLKWLSAAQNISHTVANNFIFNNKAIHISLSGKNVRT